MAHYVADTHELRAWPSLEDAQCDAGRWIAGAKPSYAATFTVSVAIPIEHAKQQLDGSWCMEPIEVEPRFHSPACDLVFLNGPDTDITILSSNGMMHAMPRQDAIRLRDWLTRVLR